MSSRQEIGRSDTGRNDGQRDHHLEQSQGIEVIMTGQNTDLTPSSNNRGSSAADQKSRRDGRGESNFCLRSLWATRQTEETKTNPELYVKTTIRELLVYIVFLVVLCIITFGMTSTNMYYYTKVMSDLFLETKDGTDKTFKDISSIESFWNFAKGPLLKGLYWETNYNNSALPNEKWGYIYYENKLLGVPRIRQLKVHNDSCQVHEDFTYFISECFDSYSESAEDHQPFGLHSSEQNNTAWQYYSESMLEGGSHWGKVDTYSGAGYYKDLTSTKNETEAIIDNLYQNLWIQRGTRAVFIDFSVYNANVNLFCIVRLLIEFPATGGAIPSWNFRTVKLIRYVTAGDYFIMACEIIFCVFILYYIIEEILEISQLKLTYFMSFWNILDIFIIIISIICVAFDIYRIVMVSHKLSQLLKAPGGFMDFDKLSYWEKRFSNAIAIAAFLAWIKLFKYISFNKTMTQLSSTLGRCAKDLAGFFVMFIIIFLAFTQLGYLLFGTQVKDFSSFENSFFTLFRIILGDFDFYQLEHANRILGPIYFILFVFFVFFVLINMFLAIINDTYSEVKSDMANAENEFEIVDYFKQAYLKMLDRLNLRRNKILNIQQALQTADTNQDKQLDFDEWRRDLKLRGYADDEIEAVFSKFDIDQNLILDEEEQKHMKTDLAYQEAALNKEYEDLVDKTDKGGYSGHQVSISIGKDGDNEDNGTRASSNLCAHTGASCEEITVLARRVDRLEHSIGGIVSKIDVILVKLEGMEKARLKRWEAVGKTLDIISKSDAMSEERKQEQMEKLVREELGLWNLEMLANESRANGESLLGGSGNEASAVFKLN